MTFKAYRDWSHLGVDQSTRTMQTIEYEHHEIHAGSSYTTDYQTDVANGASMNVMILTPDTTKYAHLIYDVEVEAESNFYLYESGTVSASGTALSVINRNRNSSSTNTVVVYHTPTITGNGTAIRTWLLGSGKQAGGPERQTLEFVLKRNTRYFLKVINDSGGASRTNMRVDWYEHTDKDELTP